MKKCLDCEVELLDSDPDTCGQCDYLFGQAVDWMDAVRKYGIEEANRRFP